MQVLGAGGALGGPARPGGNFGGKTPNLGAAPHDWGFAKKRVQLLFCAKDCVQLRAMLASVMAGVIILLTCL